jgi:putative Holliday junction resolvase
MAHAVVEPRKYYHLNVRVLAIDFGRRRIGLAISDRTRTLARPLSTLQVGRDDAVDRVASEVARLAAQDDGLSQIVVGLPLGLDGVPHKQTRAAERFITALRLRTGIPIDTADERLTSREAESQLAVRDRDWRSRKSQIDAAAAAIVLQEYLDRS